ncbi:MULTISPECIES: DUF6245 family protein [unclassified Frankia]|uniref:DUF6245 family protein n=1 Tax=unclassified Frankia TaxID=2632575 RepID=UPI001EF50798|nr:MULTISPECIES: DUF6245 family protein [unclassified Frankia]
MPDDDTDSRTFALITEVNEEIEQKIAAHASTSLRILLDVIAASQAAVTQGDMTTLSAQPGQLHRAREALQAALVNTNLLLEQERRRTGRPGPELSATGGVECTALQALAWRPSGSRAFDQTAASGWLDREPDNPITGAS